MGHTNDFHYIKVTLYRSWIFEKQKFVNWKNTELPGMPVLIRNRAPSSYGTGESIHKRSELFATPEKELRTWLLARTYWIHHTQKEDSYVWVKYLVESHWIFDDTFCTNGRAYYECLCGGHWLFFKIFLKNNSCICRESRVPSFSLLCTTKQVFWGFTRR